MVSLVDGDRGNLCTETHPKSALEWKEHELDRVCREGMEANLWAKAVLESESKGLVTINWALAHQCIAQTRYLRATSRGYELRDSSTTAGAAWLALIDSQSGACGTFMQSNGTENTPCMNGWDCQAGLSCSAVNNFDPNGARCLKLAALGEECSSVRFCADDLYCLGGVCTPKHVVGEACDPNALGDDCVGANCQQPYIDECLAVTEKALCEQNSHCAWVFDATISAEFCNSVSLCQPPIVLAPLHSACTSTAGQDR
jgi:hypothetical protein